MARIRKGHRSDDKAGRLTRVLLFLTAAAAVVAAVAFALMRDAAGAPPRPLPPGAGLVFDEDFSAGGLRPDRWAVETPWHTRYATGELQWYQPENVSFPGGGIMRISTEKQRVVAPHGLTYEYTSAMLTTGSRYDRGGESRVAFKYGYFEMRARLPRGKGVFPAFWLTNDRTSEIDVVELLGHQPRKVYMTLRRLDHDKPRIQQREFSGPDFTAGYHTFAVDWRPDFVRFYVDGEERATFTEDVPNEPLWLVVNTAVGGEWPGDPDGTTPFPQYLDVDYIRVWQTREQAK